MIGTFDEAKVGKYILSLMKEIAPNIYANEAIESAKPPYAVFELVDVPQGEGTKSTFTLEVNIWDNKGSKITDILKLKKDIQDFFHKKQCNQKDFFVKFELDIGFGVPQADSQLRNRQLNFECTYYSK